MNRLRELREDKDLYQKDVASILHMSQTGYSQYETETNDIPTDILKKLANFYNTSVDYLLYLTDERRPYKKSSVLTDDSNKINNQKKFKTKEQEYIEQNLKHKKTS